MERRKVKNGEKSRSLLFFAPHFSARLDFPSCPVSAPGSPRMILRTKDTFLAFLYHFFSFVIVLSVLDAFFLVSEDPVDDVETQSANHKYR